VHVIPRRCDNRRTKEVASIILPYPQPQIAWLTCRRFTLPLSSLLRLIELRETGEGRRRNGAPLVSFLVIKELLNEAWASNQPLGRAHEGYRGRLR
jgi:hypothetical protein